MDNNNPTIYTTPSVPTSNKRWFQTWKIIYPILGIMILVELVFGLKTLFSPLPKSQIQKLQPIAGARIVLSSSKNSYKVGEVVPVIIRIVTRGHETSGTDFVLHFNPKILEASASSFTQGKIYNDYPLISIDTKTGLARISGIASSAKQAFNGVGELGTIRFTAKAKGSVNLIVDFRKGLTNESNVFDVNDSLDILQGSNNLKLTIN